MRIDLVMERLKLGRLRHRAQLRRTPLLRARLETILHGEIETDPREKKPGPGNKGADHRAAVDRELDRLAPRINEREIGAPGEKFGRDERGDEDDRRLLATRPPAQLLQYHVNAEAKREADRHEKDRKSTRLNSSH